jgi:hypothetical protein
LAMDPASETRSGVGSPERAGLCGDVAAGLHGASMPSDVVAQEIAAGLLVAEAVFIGRSGSPFRRLLRD